MSYKKGVCMITIRYRLFKSILMVCILQFMIGCGGDSVDDLTDAAGRSNDVEKVKQILTDNPKFIDQSDSKGTALHWAINFGNIEIIEVLLARGADITIVDSAGNTPVTIAIRARANFDQDLGDGSTTRLNMIKMLLEADSKLSDDRRTINVPDPDGYTPLDCATDYPGYDRIIEVLKANGAKTNAELKE